MDMQHGEMSEEKMAWKMKHREYKAIRALTVVIIVIFAFWVGFQFGQIRATAGSMRGYGMQMMRGGSVGGYTGGTGHALMIPAATTGTTAK